MRQQRKFYGILGFLVLILSFLSVPGLRAQVDTGAVVGTVKDQAGAVIPSAKVTLTNEATNYTISTETESDGGYVFTPVKVGAYTVTAEIAGFRKELHFHVAVNIQQQVLVNFTLQTGMVTQTVNVNAAPPSLQTQNASIQQVVSARAANDLPLSARNSTFLAQLSAGVTFMQSDSRGVKASGGFAANGQRPVSNDYLLDGIDNNSDIADVINEAYYVVLPPPDALEEFTVQTNNYSAEFGGHSAGAVINAALKTGTNHFHGDAWEFLRNSGVDANNFFLNAANEPIAEYRQNQFGFTLGGPVTLPHVYNGKDKTFFFVDYQGTRIRQGLTYVRTVPTAAERNSGYTNFQDLIAGQTGTRTDSLGRVFPSGAILDPATTRPVTKGQVDPVTGLVAAATGYVRDPFYAGSLTGVTNFTSAAATAQLNALPTGRLGANAIKLLQLYPLPNGPGVLDNLTDAPVESNNQDSFDARVDHNFSDHDTMFGSYSYSTASLFYPGPFAGIADGSPNRPGSGTTLAQHAALSETHIFSPTTINEFRIGYSRLHDIRLQFDGNNLSDIPGQFGIQGVPQVPENGGLPLFSLGSLSSLGAPAFLPSDKWSNTLQVSENVTKITGSHSIRTGFEFQDVRFPMISPPDTRGTITFNGEYTSVVNSTDGSTAAAQLLLTPVASTAPGGINNVGGANTVAATNFRPFADYRRTYYGGYIQDSWRATQKLTLNLGLRYDWFAQPSEYFGSQANFVPGLGFAGGKFLIAQSRAGEVPSAFVTLLAANGIAFTPTTGTVWQQAPYGDWGPRLGFAYHAAKNWVIRGGYAMFYGGQEDFGLSQYGANSFPFLVQSSFTAPNAVEPITPNNSIGLLENGLLNVPLASSAARLSGISLIGSQLSWKDPSTQSYNFALQRQISPSTAASITYAGSQTRHLVQNESANEVTELLPPNANKLQYAPYPSFAYGGVYNLPDANGNFNALEANIERRFTSGFSLLGNYTYSKCRTDSRDNLDNNIGGYRAQYLAGFGIEQDYALCDFDTRNIVHLSGTYALPFGQGKYFLNRPGFLNEVIGGWTTNWILDLQDGQPFTVGCTATSTAGLGCNALLVPGQSVIAGPHNVSHWINAVAFTNPSAATSIGQTNFAPLGGAPTQAVGPGVHDLDFSLFKSFRVSESKSLEFRAEVFNLTNTPDFSNPSSLNFLNPAQFGKITGTQTNARLIQFALKFYF
ncbi:MAG: carboxypeptidase regulatory-like domain-containing protein [Terriglobia bacterium]